MTDDTNSSTKTDEQQAPELPTSVREGLRDATVPLATTDPRSESDLEPVADRLAEATVIGLGESTHGTREFFTLKHRIIRNLVIQHGLRAVALETNLPETMALHDYVVHGEGDPRAALRSVHAECWHVESVLSLVEWLRAFNACRPVADRVALYGFAGHSTHGAVEGLREQFDAVDADFLVSIAADLAVVDDGNELLREDDLTAVGTVDEWTAVTERVVQTVRNHLDGHRAAHVSATSERAWARARRYVAVIEQTLTKTRALDAFEGDARTAYTRAQYLRRMRETGLPGRTMADNVAWIRDRADADTVVLWAHDAHINRGSFTFPGVDASAPSLGRCLAEQHGDGYVAVGFSFGRGQFRAIRERDDGGFEPSAVSIDAPVPGTLDAALDSLDDPQAFVDLRAAGEDDRTADWLTEPRAQFRTGGTYDADGPADQLVEYVYADAFDGFCFVAETTPARPLDGESTGDDEETVKTE
jgi:erythromycin esterase